MTPDAFEGQDDGHDANRDSAQQSEEVQAAGFGGREKFDATDVDGGEKSGKGHDAEIRLG